MILKRNLDAMPWVEHLNFDHGPPWEFCMRHLSHCGAFATFRKQNVTTDLFELDHEHYLTVVDYYYFELAKLPTRTSSTVINKMKAIFV